MELMAKFSEMIEVVQPLKPVFANFVKRNYRNRQ